jgi:Putative peptidoglycan binding domain
MSTQSYTQSQPASYEQAPYQPTRHDKGGPSWFRIWSIVIGTVAAAALVALAVVMPHSHTTTIQTPAASTPTASTSAPAQPAANPAVPSQPAANPAVPAQPTGGSTTNPVTPSASVKNLQQQLGQLNYYEGSNDGIMGPQTIAAIKDLQRQAGLPQTGQMNTATQAALNNYLIHGNNQMAG